MPIPVLPSRHSSSQESGSHVGCGCLIDGEVRWLVDAKRSRLEVDRGAEIRANAPLDLAPDKRPKLADVVLHQAAAARSANFAYCEMKESLTLSVGPFRCFATITSATPGSGESSGL
jgi:hypothetical protein